MHQPRWHTFSASGLPVMYPSRFQSPGRQSNVNSAVWRSSPAMFVSSPESSCDNEEDMDLDTSDEVVNTTSTCFLWSRSLSVNSSRNEQPSNVTTLFSLNLSDTVKQIGDTVNCSQEVSIGRKSVGYGWPPGIKSSSSSSVSVAWEQKVEFSGCFKGYKDEGQITAETSNSDYNLDEDIVLASDCRTEPTPVEAVSQCTASTVAAKEDAGYGRSYHSCMRLIIICVTVALVAILVCVQLPFISDQKCLERVNVTLLQQNLLNRLYGQHIAVQSVLRAVADFNEDSNRRTLVMLFVGWTGVGKNFMSQLISEQFPPATVHKIIVPLHLAHQSPDDGDNLYNWIMSNMSSTASCRLRLFIIDEVDKMTSVVITSLQRALTKLSTESHNRDTRAIYLLLSNDGAENIISHLSHVLSNGGVRESVELVDLKPAFTSRELMIMIDSNVVGYVVPFLPLEKIHIIQCIETELRIHRMPVSEDLINSILSRVQFSPPDLKLFAKSGCRKISYLVDFIAY